MKKWIAVVLFILILLTGSSFAAEAPVKENLQKAAGDVETYSFEGAVVLCSGSPVAMAGNAVKTIEPGNLKIRPQVQDGFMMVPVRFIAESLGGKAVWRGASNTAVLEFGGTTVELMPGSSEMKVNGKKIALKAEAYSENGRVYAYAIQIAEAIGWKAFVDNGLVVVSKSGKLPDPGRDRKLLDETARLLAKPPAVTTREGLNGVLRQVYADWVKYRGDGSLMKRKGNAEINMAVMNEAASKTAAADADTANGTASGADSPEYSGTNVQVEGVDEADIVKTDGTYIYSVVEDRIFVVRAYPAEEMKLVSTIKLADSGIHPQELYVDGDRLVVIGISNSSIAQDKKVASKVAYGSIQQQTTKAVVFDCKDRSQIKKIREIELEGSYLSSRKIGSKLYLVANKDFSRVFYGGWDGSVDTRPAYRDSTSGGEMKYVDYSRIYCFPESTEPSYLIIAGLDIKDDAAAADLYTCIGSGENIFVSAGTLYAAFGEYRSLEAGGFGGKVANTRQMGTVIYKFSLGEGRTSFVCKGTVNGTVLNQFSMDEYAGSLRVATTSGYAGGTGEYISKNNVYVLDENLRQTGSLEDLAPGETIYSVRFMGERGYIVTYRTIDPLFVIDLKDKTAPKVLGALKIPGYSDYLHPYDDNHIIGFGKDTVEVKGNAYYKGMKLAMFDVTDVSKPVQLFTEYIGDRGTDSELLRNHKALMFSKEKGLMAFPVTLMEAGKDSGGEKDLQYGTFAFQGAYVYQVDLQKGFTLKGRITHLDKEDYLKAGDGWYDSVKNVDRILYINDVLYTLSQSKIMASGLADLKEKGSVELK